MNKRQSLQKKIKLISFFALLAVLLGVAPATNATWTSYPFTPGYSYWVIPAPPTGVIATSGACGSFNISVSWSLSTGASSYTVWRSLSPSLTSPTITSGVTTPPYVSTGLVAGTTYYFAVQAANGGGSSTTSTPVVNAIAPPGVCPPTVTTANPVTSITQSAALGGGLITSSVGASVPAGSSGLVWNTTGAPSLPTTFKTIDGGTTVGVSWSSNMTGLSANTRYYVRGYATNSAGTGYGSDVVFDTLPNIPTGLTATPGACSSGTIAVSWTASAGGATSYTLRDNGANIYTGAATSFSHTGLVASSSHSYSVLATNASSGSSSFSGNVAATAPAASCAAPDLTAAAPAPATATAGSSLSLTSLIQNIGGATTGASFSNFFQANNGAGGAGSSTLDLPSASMATLAGGASNTATYNTSSVSNVTWQNVVNSSASGNSLTNTSGVGWNAGASSTQTIASGDGYIEASTNETTTHKMIGMSPTDATQNYTEQDHGIYLAAGGTVTIYENIPTAQTFSVGTYLPGDIFRIAIEGGVVNYYKNGVLLRTSNRGPTYPVHFDVSSTTVGATVINAKIASGYTFPYQGTYSIRACADKTNSASAGVITESNEANNCSTWTNVTVSPAAVIVAPTVTTTTPTTPTFTGATGGGGNITSNGGAAVTVSGLVWDLAANPTTALATKTTDGGTTVGTPWTSAITSLQPGTTYHVRAYATNSAGTGYGSDVTFSTTTPTVTVTPNPTTINTNPSTAISFVYTTTANPGAAECQLLDNTSTVIGPLPTPNTYQPASPINWTSPSGTGTYTYFIKCRNITYTSFNATSVAITVNNTAANAIPTVTTPTVTGITSSGATLGANVVNLGIPAAISARGTCFATTTGPTIANGATCLADGITTLGVFTQARTGLSPGVTYFFSGYATNTTGTGYSVDGTFSTTALPDVTASVPPQISATAGTPISFTSNIQNIGGASTGASAFTNLFQFDNDSDHVTSVTSAQTVSAGPIAAAGTAPVSSSYTFPTAGTWYVRVCADNNASFVGTVTESNEGNNCSSPWQTVSVSVSALGPTATISASKNPINLGETLNLTWTSANADYCTSDFFTNSPNPNTQLPVGPFTDPKLNGTVPVTPASLPKTYNLSCASISAGSTYSTSIQITIRKKPTYEEPR